jgi:hypothetical protein
LFYTIHGTGLQSSRQSIYIIIAATELLDTGCRDTSSIDGAEKHLVTKAKGVEPSATTGVDKTETTQLQVPVVGALLMFISQRIHHWPGDGEAVSPWILAISSSLAPQAAAISERDSSSLDG